MTQVIKIGNYDVNKDSIFVYVHHFAKDREDLFYWEKTRKILHDGIFERIGLDRHSEEGQNFSKQLDTFCEPHLERFDSIAVRAKKLSHANTADEIKVAAHMLELEVYKQQKISELGFRNFNEDDEPMCRICSKDMNKEGGRVNDHLACVAGFDRMINPICIECSKNKPDDYHIEFKKQYWSK